MTVVTLFLVTELPHSVANILSGLSDAFVEDVYMNLGDLIDILALVNNGINFILYCTMSAQFRKTFVEIFVAPVCRRRRRSLPRPSTAATAVPLVPGAATTTVTATVDTPSVACSGCALSRWNCCCCCYSRERGWSNSIAANGRVEDAENVPVASVVQSAGRKSNCAIIVTGTV